MTTTTGQSNLGPLTTTFTPPPECTEVWYYHLSTEATLRWGYGCFTTTSYTGVIKGAASCFPPGFTTAMTGGPDTMNYVYSPASICPHGWTAAYTSTYGSANPHDKNYDIGANSVTMVADDILTACCPSGYSLVEPSWCNSGATSLGPRETLSFDLSGSNRGSCATETIDAFTGVIGNSSIRQADLQAQPVFLIRNTAKSSSIASSTDLSSASTSDASQNGSSSGLSTGAKIAIGVCAPMGVLILAAGCFIMWHRRRKAGVSAELEAAETEKARELRPAGLDLKTELDSSMSVTSRSATSPRELSASDQFAHEIGGIQRCELEAESKFELDGSSPVTTEKRSEDFKGS